MIDEDEDITYALCGDVQGGAAMPAPTRPPQSPPPSPRRSESLIRSLPHGPLDESARLDRYVVWKRWRLLFLVGAQGRHRVSTGERHGIGEADAADRLAPVRGHAHLIALDQPDYCVIRAGDLPRSLGDPLQHCGRVVPRCGDQTQYPLQRLDLWKPLTHQSRPFASPDGSSRFEVTSRRCRSTLS